MEIGRSVRDHFAAAFAELGQSDRERSSDYDIAGVTAAERGIGNGVRAVEQLASCRVRSAGALLASAFAGRREKASDLGSRRPKGHSAICWRSAKHPNDGRCSEA